MGCITFITDFGRRDWFVGTMKGVVLRIAPQARLVDLTHEVAPGDIRAGAFTLAASYAFFPRNTIHVAIVDPGVGTARQAIAVQTSEYTFVGPDNGLLSWALAREKVRAIHSLQNKDYLLPDLSATFHGRDVFAPVAAHLSAGVAIRDLGPKRRDFWRLEWPEPRVRPQRVEGQIMYIDRFGNAITNLSAGLVNSFRNESGLFRGRQRICGLGSTYQSVASGRAVAVFGSTGFLEIAINGGSAAKRFKLRVGTPVELRRGRD